MGVGACKLACVRSHRSARFPAVFVAAFAFALHCVLQETRAKLLVGRFSRTIENERMQEPRSRSVRSWPGPLSSSVTVRRTND